MTQAQTHNLEWNGITLEIKVQADQLSSRITGEEHATIEVKALNPGYLGTLYLIVDYQILNSGDTYLISTGIPTRALSVGVRPTVQLYGY
ncbi:MAG: hypothetical protein JNM12_08810 [Alphaproteobacteria bacterium]|nr:hypothetical protein [Alphaproteobacteria bacterium]